MMYDPQDPFDTGEVFIRQASPKTTSFIRSMLAEQQAPKSLRERNLAQLMLGERVARNFDLPIESAVEAVAPLYESRFPKPRAVKPMVRRPGNASILS